MDSENHKKDVAYTIELSGSKGTPYYQLISEELTVVDLIFDSIEDAKLYALAKGLPLKEGH